MRTETFGRLRARVTGGIDREGGGDGPAVVLFHGYGAPGDDLVPLARVLSVPRETRFVFPEAPISLSLPFGFPGMESRAWWHIDMERLERAMAKGEHEDMADHVPDGLPEAREMAVELLDAVAERLRPSTLVLGGFSQGAMLASDLAFQTERRLDGLVLLSGTLLAESSWVSGMRCRPRLPVFQSHGQRDPLLSFRAAERLRDLLVASDLSVTFVPFVGGHEIPAFVLDRLGVFLTSVVDRPTA